MTKPNRNNVPHRVRTAKRRGTDLRKERKHVRDGKRAYLMGA